MAGSPTTDVDEGSEPEAPTWRERQREATRDEIKAIARTHLTEAGSSALSLRSIARELGMVVSALYRYFPGRDELITALIADAYDSLAETVEVALASCDPDDPENCWRTVAHAFRRWALDHPGEYALVYGTPVPGYVAPEDTMGPAFRFYAALTTILVNAERVG
jgi:AcrR family transcriptional regulator